MLQTVPEAGSFPAAPDWRHLHEQQKALTEAAEARRVEAVDARQAAGSWRSCFQRCREKLAAVSAELSSVRRAAKRALGMQAEVTRLRRLLAATTVAARKRSPIASLRMENGRLRAALQETASRAAKLPAEVEKLRSIRETLTKAAFCGKSEKAGRRRTGPCNTPLIYMDFRSGLFLSVLDR